MIPVREYATAEENVRHARELRARMFSPAAGLAAEAQRRAREEEASRRETQRETKIRQAKEARMAETLAESEQRKQALDDLVFEILDPAQVDRTPRRIIDRTAKEHGYTRAQIIGNGRDRAITHARRCVIVALKKVYPDIGFSQLGRILERDHTTIIYHLALIETMTPHQLETPWFKLKKHDRPVK